MSKTFEALKKEYSKGWRTWNNESVLSFVYMPDGVGICLGVKNYQRPIVVERALIGESGEQEVTPRAHAYDGGYTDLTLCCGADKMRIESAAKDGDLSILITPIEKPLKCSTIFVYGVVLWNREGCVRKVKDAEGMKLLLEGKSGTKEVFATELENGELFTNCISPYLAVDLDHAVGICAGKKKSLEEIQADIAAGRAAWEANKAKYGELAECYNAMQTAQAWDTIYNPQRDVPITTVSRIWNKWWGGYVLFDWDSYFGALMQSLDEKELAYCNAIEITNTLTPAGFVPNFASQNNFKTFDRSQPPVGAMIVWQIYEQYQEKWFLEEVYENLCIWNEWYYTNRQTKNGLMTWGSNPYEPITGHHFEYLGIDDMIAAKWESGLDNSPMYDDVPYDKTRHQMSLDDVGLTGLYIHDCRCLAKIAGTLGDTQKAEAFVLRAEEFEEKLESLWDEEAGMYCNRRTDTGALDHRYTPFHFHALFSHKVGRARAARMIKEHMLNPDEFWGTYVLPSITRDDPAYKDNDYWRGRIWAPMNFLVYKALSEYDFAEVQTELADKSRDLIMKEWLAEGHVHENYNSDTGEGCDVQNSDKFYHWGGLLSYIALLDSAKKKI